MKHLKYFVEVARQRSFSKAADTVFVSQSTVSKMIKDLEAELNVNLFNRNSKYVELTDAGQILFNQAQQLITLFENLPIQFENEAKLEQGKISIGLPPITGATDFARLLGIFKKEYPNIDIVLFEYGSKKIEPAICEGIVDVGVALTCTPINNENLEIFPYTKDPLQVIIHPNNPLSQMPRLNMSMLSNESFVLYRNDYSLHDAIKAHCNIAGFQPKIILETSEREVMIQIVASNLGIALLPSKICERINSNTVVAVPLEDPQIWLYTSLIWSKQRYLSYAARLWLQFAKRYLMENS